MESLVIRKGSPFTITCTSYADTDMVALKFSNGTRIDGMSRVMYKVESAALNDAQNYSCIIPNFINYGGSVFVPPVSIQINVVSGMYHVNLFLKILVLYYLIY